MSEQESTLDEFVNTSSNTVEEGQNWEVQQLRDLVKQLQAGGTPDTNKDEYYDGNIPWVKTGELGQLKINSTEQTITEQGLNKSTAQLFPSKTVLIAMYGATTGELSILDTEAATNQACCGIIPKNQIIPYYLYYQLIHGKQKLRSFSAGSGQQNISKSILEKYRIPVAPLSEQHKISTVLYTVDQAIEKTEEITYKYQSIISGLIQDIATTGIHNQNLEERKVPMLPERWKMPKHWELEFLENITTLITDGAHITPTYVENGMPFLKVENIKQEKIEWDSVSRIPEEEHNDLIKSGNPTKGDVLLSKNGTIGITKVVDWEREFSHFVSLALIRPKQDIILSDYLSTLLESQICMRQAEARSKTGTVTNLHLEEIRKLSIPVPPISEQKEILEKISAVENCLSTEIRYLNRLRRLKQGLMQDLLSGTVRTTDTNITVPDEVAQHG